MTHNKTYAIRLPRRYAATMKTLQELMQSNSERVRLQAVLRASDILLEHDRSIERMTIATQRARARQAEADAGMTITEEPDAGTPEAPKETLDEFLARIATMTTKTNAGVSTGVTELEDKDDEEDGDDE